jgi:high-affinity nickel-transport protein
MQAAAAPLLRKAIPIRKLCTPGALTSLRIGDRIVQRRRDERLVEEDLDMLLNKRGFLSRIFRPLFHLVSRSWHMHPIGFLFGLGFDTATEVVLFGISAPQAAEGMSFATILIFPALFTAGMCLVDTADGVLMLGAYAGRS